MLLIVKLLKKVYNKKNYKLKSKPSGGSVCNTGETLLKATRPALIASVHVHMTAAVQFAAVVELPSNAALEEATAIRRWGVLLVITLARLGDNSPTAITTEHSIMAA